MLMRTCALIVLAFLSACRGDPAPGGGGASQVEPAAASAPAPKIEPVTIDMFGTRQITRQQMLAAVGQPLREYAAAGGGLDLELQIVDELRKLGDFAHVGLTLVGYHDPDGISHCLTVDFVDRADADRRMPFVPEPTNAYDDPEGLLADWATYEARRHELLSTQQTSAKRTECPAFHCLGDHAHPELKPLTDKFVSRAPEHAATLAAILRDDFDEAHRAAAALLLAYQSDGADVVAQMVPAFRDSSSLVRNNAMRVVMDIAFYHPEVDVPLEPVLDALSYPETLDRNKAAAIIDGLLERPGAEPMHARVRQRAGATLVEMLRLEQRNNHNFAYSILRKISGQSFGERDYAAWEAWLKTP